MAIRCLPDVALAEANIALFINSYGMLVISGEIKINHSWRTLCFHFRLFHSLFHDIFN